jgi:hypothetical protein
MKGKENKNEKDDGCFYSSNDGDDVVIRVYW